MKELMRCLYCGLLQDEPIGAKQCLRCGGELIYERQQKPDKEGYLKVQMELDQILAPAGKLVDRYLMIGIKTPAELDPVHLPKTESTRPALSLTCVLDSSGSMRGPKFENAIQAVRQAVYSLFPGDSFALIRFDEEARVVIPAQTIVSHSAAAIQEQLEQLRCGGSTALYDGLSLGIEQAQAERRETTLIMLLSDGYANIGETGVEEIGRLATMARKKNFIVSTLGLGVDYNEALMIEIATQGGGRYYHLLNAHEIIPTLNGELGESATSAARKVEVELHLPEGSVAMPLSPLYPARQDGRKAYIRVGDIPLDMEIEIPVRLTTPAMTDNTKAAIEGTVRYESPAGEQLAAQLNRVTIRVTSTKLFHMQDGIVMPVAKRVLDQMTDIHFLNRARVYASNQPDAYEREEASRKQVREYASHLGEDTMLVNEARINEDLNFMASSPMSQKSRLDEIYQRQRRNRRFNQ